MRKIFLLIAFVVAIVYSCKGNRVTSIGVDDEDDGKTRYVSTKEDFDKIILEASEGNEFEGETIKLKSDLDLKNEEFEGISYDGDKQFKGKFDGGGKTISGVNIVSDKKNVGFISDVYTGNKTNTIVIKNLTVSGKLVSTSTSEGSSVGGLLGGVSGDYAIVISNVTSKIEITANSLTGTSYVGGIVANLQVSAKIYNVTNYGSIETTASYVGGIIGGNSGYFDGSIISNVYNGGDIKTTTTGNPFVGGIAGSISTDIHWAVNKGNITGGKNTGGILGGTGGDQNRIKKVYKVANFGNVVGNYYTGGIAGNANSLSIEDAYNVGTIKGNDATGATGGIAGVTDKNTTLKYSYNIGSLSGNAAKGSITGCYSVYNTTSSGGTYERVSFLNTEIIIIINKRINGTYTGETTLGGVTGYSAGSISSGVILTELKNKSNPNATIWGEKSTDSVNGVTTRPYIIGLE